MAYYGPRRKSKLQKACEALDPGVKLIDHSFSDGGFWVTSYEVRDGAGTVIGYTDPKDPARFAWSMALETLQRRAAGARR
jgi:hypothetical protein